MTPPARLATWFTVAAIVAVCVPTLIFSYLPMTDLPQHAAVVSIIEHYDNPAFGFAAFYEVDWTRTPYVLPYAIWIAVGKLLGLAAGMHVAVFLSVIAYPLGVLAIVRAAGKPAWFALLAIPFVYNRAFFWGFMHFNMGVGLALAAFALYVSPRKSVARDAIQAVAILAATFCHVYGLALVAMLVVTYAIVGGWRALRSRWWTTLPIGVGAVVWLLGTRVQHGYGYRIEPLFSARLDALPREILGGYLDSSELGILAVFVGAFLVLGWSTLPTSRARLRALTPLERVAWISFAGNLWLYFILPQATFTAKFIHFRHAILACALLPLLASTVVPRVLGLLARVLPAALAIATIANTWVHFRQFDREARGFSDVVAAIPQAPRIVGLTLDPVGGVMATHPYLHFAAYAQAEKGGLIAMTFPSFFWNLPVTMRADTSIPPTPDQLEWNPGLYNDAAFGYFYDHALVRMRGDHVLPTTAAFPFQLVASSLPWQLYRRVNASPSSPSMSR